MSKLTALQRHFVTEEIEQDYDIFTVDGTEYLVLTIDEVLKNSTSKHWKITYKIQ